MSAVAIWCCPECGNIAKLAFPTYFSISRICDHWISGNSVRRYVMQPVNQCARVYDEFEAEKRIEDAAIHKREAALTTERADWRFGFV